MRGRSRAGIAQGSCGGGRRAPLCCRRRAGRLGPLPPLRRACRGPERPGDAAGAARAAAAAAPVWRYGGRGRAACGYGRRSA